MPFIHSCTTQSRHGYASCGNQPGDDPHRVQSRRPEDADAHVEPRGFNLRLAGDAGTLARTAAVASKTVQAASTRISTAHQQAALCVVVFPCRLRRSPTVPWQKGPNTQ